MGGSHPGYPSGVPMGAPGPAPASAPQQSGPGRPDEGPEFESSELQSKEAAAWTAHKAATGQVRALEVTTSAPWLPCGPACSTGTMRAPRSLPYELRLRCRLVSP